VRAHQASEAYAIERTTQMLLERYQEMFRKGSRRKRTFRARMLRFFDGWAR
jgi:hypothetical protein